VTCRAIPAVKRHSAGAKAKYNAHHGPTSQSSHRDRTCIKNGPPDCCLFSRGSPACRVTSYQILRGELSQHIFAGVVLAAAAVVTLAFTGQAASRNTCGVTARS
jgi:hypothetical protein